MSAMKRDNGEWAAQLGVKRFGKRTRTNQTKGKESGVYAVVVVLVATLLLGLTALGVDLANARLVRTQAQSTADAAVLAAAQDLPDQVKVVATVKAYALDNFKLAATAWAGCQDDGAFSTVIDTDTTNHCITTNVSKTRLRVRLPVTNMRTSFGRSIGVENIKIRAFAEAEATPAMDSRMFPTAIMQTDGDGLECLEDGGASTPCGPPHTGTFGSINSPRLNIHKIPGNGVVAEHDKLRLNYAVGIDHGLTTDSVLTKVCDGPAVSSIPCPGNENDPSLLANYLDMAPGGGINPVTDGMVDGGSVTTSDPVTSSKPYCGRLARPDRTPANISQLQPGGVCAPSAPTMTVSSTLVNGHHVSMWLTPAAKAYFYPEVVGTPLALDHPSYSAGDVRLNCYLKYYNPVSHAASPPAWPTCPLIAGVAITGLGVPIFLPGIVDDVRYGTIPIICEVSVVPCTRPGPSVMGAIKQFKGAFVYKLFENSGGKVESFNGWVFDLWLIQPGSTPLGASSIPIVHLSK